MMNNNEVYVSVPKMRIIEMENSGAESGHIHLPFCELCAFFLSFIHHLNRHFLSTYYVTRCWGKS